jgi:hypothetical protein
MPASSPMPSAPPVRWPAARIMCQRTPRFKCGSSNCREGPDPRAGRIANATRRFLPRLTAQRETQGAWPGGRLNSGDAASITARIRSRRVYRPLLAEDPQRSCARRGISCVEGHRRDFARAKEAYREAIRRARTDRRRCVRGRSDSDILAGGSPCPTRTLARRTKGSHRPGATGEGGGGRRSTGRATGRLADFRSSTRETS